MLELFRVEAENQAAVLTSGLLELERGPGAPDQLETLMRAAHSLKGAARIVNLHPAVSVAHAMEDCFVAAQNGKVVLRQAEIDALLRGVDVLLQISKRTEADIAEWETEHAAQIQELLQGLRKLTPDSKAAPTRPGAQAAPPAPAAPVAAPVKAEGPAPAVPTGSVAAPE